MVDDIGKALTGHTAEQVFFAFEHLKGFESVLAGRRISAVEGWSFGRRRHMVFNRESEACHDCGAAIIKSLLASRRLYSCPACQRIHQTGH